MAPLLTLITFLVAAALAVGYACEAGLPSWRRATACVLALVLATGTGQLLTSAHPTLAYAVGIPSLLLLGAVMIAPERRAPQPATPNRRASDRVRPTRTATRWHFDRRASRRRTARPLRPDTSGAYRSSGVTDITAGSRSTHVSHAPAVTRAPGRTAVDPEWAAKAVLAARRHHSRRATPRSLSRMSRCRCR